MAVFFIPVAVSALLVLLYLVYDRARFRGQGAGARGLKSTSEVFCDPASGERMRVYEDPATGAREYRREDERPYPNDPRQRS